MRLNLNLSKKGLILVSIPLAFQLIFITILIGLLHEAQQEVLREAQSKMIIFQAATLSRLFQDAGVAIGGYNLTRSIIFSDPSEAILAKIRKNFNQQQEAGSKRQEMTVEQMNRAVEQGMVALESARQTIEGKAEKPISMSELNKELKSVGQQLSSELSKLEQEDKEIEMTMAEANRRSRDRVQIFLLAGVLASVALTVWLAQFFSSGITRRLKILTENTSRLASGKELKPPLSGTDEIAHLDIVFHKMAHEIKEATRKLEASESRLRSVIENMPIGLIGLTEEGKIEATNPSAEKILGLKAEDITGSPINDLFASSDSFRAMLATLEDPGRKISTIDLMALRSDGSQIPVEISLSQLDTDKGKRYLVNIQDVTARREIEQRKEEFISLVTHDLRSPLTSIQLFLSMLADGFMGELTDQGKTNVATAERNSGQLLKLINDLLDIEKIAQGEMPLDLRPVKIFQVLQRGAETVQNIADDRGVEIRLEPVDFEVYGDEDRLVQVAVNILSNAIKYSPEGNSVRVTTEDKGSFIEVCITDSGRGVPPELADSIFERFKQVEIKDATEKGGTGLGLPICKAIIEQHEGKIGVRPGPEKGSTFWFTLPKPEDV